MVKIQNLYLYLSNYSFTYSPIYVYINFLWIQTVCFQRKKLEIYKAYKVILNWWYNWVWKYEWTYFIISIFLVSQFFHFLNSLSFLKNGTWYYFQDCNHFIFRTELFLNFECLQVIPILTKILKQKILVK